MSGRLIVENNTGRAMRAWGCGTLFQVALTSRTYQPAIAWQLCAQSFTIQAGRSSYRVRVYASYSQCGRGFRQGASKACLPGGRPPPLPPGDYQAILFQVRHLIQAPPPVPVRVVQPAPWTGAIPVNLGGGAYFAPAPAGAEPTLTAQQAWARYTKVNTSYRSPAIPRNVSVRLGLLTLPTYYGLAYGYSWHSCPSSQGPGGTPPNPCIEWNFLNAKTGRQIVETWQLYW